MLPEPLDKITPDDLRALVENGVAESRSLDYKQELPGGQERERKEFLADVCALANSGGGHLVYGVVEERDDEGKSTGVASAIRGLADAENPEALKLSLEQRIRDGIEPRVAASTKVIPGFPAGPVLVLRVHPSWAAPHMVTFKGTSRFYARRGSGKHQMDIQEIREAFLLSSRIEDKIRQFRDQRLVLIESGRASTTFPPGPRLVLHSIPFQSVAPSSGTLFEIERLREAGRKVWPARIDAPNYRPNLDGWLLESPHQTVQMFRNGALEFVTVEVGRQEALVAEGGNRWILEASPLGAGSIEMAASFFKVHEAMGLRGPGLLLISLLHTYGCHLGDGHRLGRFDREVGCLPDLFVEDFGADVPQLLRPVLDIVWQSAGYERCSLFDQQGTWKG